MITKIKYRVKKLSGAVALLSAELMLVFISFFFSLAVLIVLIRKIFYQKEYPIDQLVFDYLSSHVTTTNTALMQFISFFGSHLFLVPAWIVMLTFFYFKRKSKWYILKLAIIALSSLLLMFGLKIFFNRSRPLIPLLKEVPGLSFPSGHAFMSLIFYGIMIYVLCGEVQNKWVRWISVFILVIIIFLIGLSRVYLRVHYTSDVIGGYCFGVMSLLILLWMLRQIEKYNAKKIPGHLNVTTIGNDILSIKSGSN